MAISSAGWAEEPKVAELPCAERVRLLKAQTREMAFTRVRGKLSVDGRIGDEAWSGAEPVTDFLQRETFEGIPATEPRTSRSSTMTRTSISASVASTATPTAPRRERRSGTRTSLLLPRSAGDGDR
jgi:hypothetical protein